LPKKEEEKYRKEKKIINSTLISKLEAKSKD